MLKPREREALQNEIQDSGGSIPMSLVTKGNKIFVACIGDQRSDGKWENFKPPAEVTIIEDRIDFNDIRKFNPEVYGFAGGEFTFKTDNHLQFSLPIEKTEDITKPVVSYNGYKFIDTDLDKLTERFEKEIIRILSGRWAGVNSVKKSEALKQELRDNRDNFFSEKYPEMLI